MIKLKYKLAAALVCIDLKFQEMVLTVANMASAALRHLSNGP